VHSRTPTPGWWPMTKTFAQLANWVAVMSGHPVVFVSRRETVWRGRSRRLNLQVRYTFSGRLTSQLTEKLPHVDYHQLGLFPKRKMAAAWHLRAVHKIIISLQNMPGRIKRYDLAW
jgi:hypothetical protein